MTTIIWYVIRHKDGLFRDKHYGWRELSKARFFTQIHHAVSHLRYNHNKLAYFINDENNTPKIYYTLPDEFEIVEIELKVLK